jgi:hypothetical protein
MYLTAQSMFSDRPLPTFRKPLATPFPTEADVRGFMQDFVAAVDAKAFLESQGIGERYSTNAIDADFIQAFSRMYLREPRFWDGKVGEQFCELMRDLTDLAQKAGVR